MHDIPWYTAMVEATRCSECKAKQRTVDKYDERTTTCCRSCAKEHDHVWYQAYHDAHVCVHHKVSQCDTFGNTFLDGYCTGCFAHVFPGDTRVRYARSEELEVLRWLLERFAGREWAFVSDRQVVGGCSKRRPDILVDFGTHVVIVEVDEHQHNSRSYSCDNKRTMELFQDLGSRPVVFLRFNPHRYTTLDGVLKKTCWTKTPHTGEPRVASEQRAAWAARLETLATRIVHWGGVNGFPEKEVEQEFFFYDGYDGYDDD